MRRLLADGVTLTLGVIGVLAAGAAVADDWTWQRSLRGLASIRGSDDRTYRYEVKGGYVSIYLPTGRLAQHSITAAAARDPRQLADEVSALVEDLYLEG